MVANLTTRLGQLTSTPAGGPYVGKNRIINGNMAIDQRNAGASVTPTSGQYITDRWSASLGAASKFSAQQNGGSLTAPAGAANWLCATSLSAYSVSASDYFLLVQYIEGLNCADLSWGAANAQSVTLSFLVQSTLTGTFGGSILNSAHTRSYPFTYSIPVANVWTTITVTIPGDTSGTWLTTNGIGMRVVFSLGMGSTYSGTAATWATAEYYSATGAVSVVGTSGAKLAITNVQLEAGTIATPYEFNQYPTQLAQCQRYYNKYNFTTNDPVANGNAYTSSNAYGVLPLTVSMRTSPSCSWTGNIVWFSNGVTTTNTSVSFNNTTVNTVEINQALSAPAGTAGTGGWWRANGTASLAASAEL